MAPRKSRSRKTADKMASYKEKMNSEKENDCFGTPRTSPRSKKANTLSDVSTRVSGEEIEGKGYRSSRKDSSDNSLNKKNREIVSEMTRLESELVIPDTPPRQMQVAGRKRTPAPQTVPKGAEASRDGSEDSQRPSKKRKAFHNPAHGERGILFGDSPRQQEQDDDRDPTLLPLAFDAMDHDHEMVDMDLLDPDPDCASSVLCFKKTNWMQRESSLRKAKYSNERGFAKPSSNFDPDLEMLSTSSQTISRLFESFRKKITDEVRGLHRHQKSELGQMNESLKTAILSEVRDMRGVVEMLSFGGKVSSSGRSGLKTSLNEWETKLNKLTPKAEVIFSKDVFSRIICYNGPMKVVDTYKRGIGGYAKTLSAAVQALLFSLQPRDTKINFVEGNGKLHSDFKYSVVQNTFYNVCKDTFDIFASPLSGPVQATGTLLNNTAKRCGINCPSWLKVGFVTVDHINTARRMTEEVNQSRRSKIRGTPSPDDVASHGALRVYRQLGCHLHKGREYMRPSFFQDLGYLFVLWSDFVNDNDQNKMSMQFATGNEVCLNLNDIPNTEVCSFAATPETVTDVHTANKTLLKSLFSQWPGLVLHVRHDVHVTSGGGAQRRHSGGEKRNLNRLINLIEVACDVLTEYTRVGNIDIFLRSHKTALQCVMIFAFMIKELTVKFIGMRSAIISGVPKPQDVVVHNTSVKEFLPGATIQETYLKSRCLRFDEKMYERLNLPEDVTNGASREAAGEVFDVTQIEESSELGVASI